MNLYEYQQHLERKYSKRNIKDIILKEIHESKEVTLKLNYAISLVLDYMKQDYWTSKNERIRHLMTLDLEEIVCAIVSCTLNDAGTRTLTSIVGQMSPHLRFEDARDNIQTAAELIAVIAPAGFYDVIKASESYSGMIEIKPRYSLSQEAQEYIANTMYMPPMVVRPRIVKRTNDSAYLTYPRDTQMVGHKLSQGMKRLNYDVINKLNHTALSLNIPLLKTMSEELPAKLKHRTDDDAEEAKAQLNRMIEKSYAIYKDLVQTGNKFYLTHKADSRKRIYSQGYHVNYQGNSFKKAIIQLHKKELIPLD